MDLLQEQTIYMHRATFYLRRFLAASGMLELTNQHINFTVNSLDSNFGIKDLSIDLDEVEDVRVRSVGFSGRIEVQARGQVYRFALSRADEFYRRIKEVRSRWFTDQGSETKPQKRERACDCGRKLEPQHNFCPWCGSKA